MYGGGNPVPSRAPSELAEHSTSVEHSLRLLQPEPLEQPTDTPHGVVGFSDNQPGSAPTEQSETGVNWVPSRHRRRLQSSRGRVDPRCGERDYCQQRTRPQRPCFVRNLLIYWESPRSHDSRKTHHGWINKKPRRPGRSLVRLL